MTGVIHGPLALDELRRLRPPGHAARAVGLGTFDGVHQGHRAILERTLACAAEQSPQARLAERLEPIAFTFDRLPLEVLARERAPARLMPAPTRYRLLLEMGVHQVVVARFDRELARVEPEEFVESVLIKALGARCIVIGYNHTFGHKGRGDADLLRQVAGRHGANVVVVDPVSVDGEEVSSTRIRSRLASGDCSGAARLLGRPFALEGPVVEGDRRGRELGYPTANIAVSDGQLVPADGVYLTWATTPDGEGSLGYGMTVIGVKPTFGGTVRAVETHVLDYTGNLYGRSLQLAFLERLRGIVRFTGPDALREQIRQDMLHARRCIAELGDARCTFT